MSEQPECRRSCGSSLVSIHDLLAEQPESRITIKQALIRRLGEKTRQVTRADKYFEFLKNLGVLADFERRPSTLHHQVRDQETSYLCASSDDWPPARFYLNFSNTERKLPQAFRGVRRPEDLRIVPITGICLFGSGVDRATTADGEVLSVVEIGGDEVLPRARIERIDVDSRFSLYELEKIKRMSLFLNALKKANGSRFGEARLMTPRVQYYLYLMPAYEAGLISSEIYREWIAAVQARERKNSEAIRKRLDVPMRLSRSPLECIEEEMLESIGTGRPFGLQEAIEKLRRRDEGWARILRVSIPPTWRDLILRSYVVNFLWHAERLSREESTVPIHVEDPAEKVTLNQVTNFQRKMRRLGYASYPALGMYVLQNLVRKGSEEDSYLYAPQRYSWEDLRTIAREYANP